MDVINRLYKEFEIGNTLDHLVVGGDAKTYKLLQSIKLDYGEELSWLLPFPGDFHILMNYQPVLSKIYFDAGLKQLASASGFKGETLTALRKCSHFKHAHRFFMGAWEAIYIHMASTFISTNTEVSQLFEALKEVEDVTTYVTQKDDEICKLLQKFESYVKSMGKKDPNWQFWGEFILENCFAYVSLFFAVRSGNWKLRVAALKNMAPLFCAFDRPTYRKILPQHLADCLLLPSDISQSFADGNFVISINSTSWHLVALDEAHEMLINRDCKSAVIHPTKDFIHRMALYFPFRSKVLKNLKAQLYQTDTLESIDETHTCPKARKFSENAWSMKKCVDSGKLLPTDTLNQFLRNPFTNTTASPQQQQDLLTFRSIGQDDFDTFVQHTYLRISSVKVKTSTHSLKTFSTEKVGGKRLINQLQREKALVTKCLKGRLLLAKMQECVSEESVTNSI